MTFIFHYYFFYSGSVKNKNERENTSTTHFNGPATSCEELLKMGFTRNGFNLLKGNTMSNNSQIEIANCAFQFLNRNGVRKSKKKINIKDWKYILI